MRHTENEKKRIATWAARFYRRADGRITKREAEKLARHHRGDWSYVRRYADHLSARTPIAELWDDGKTCFARDAKKDFLHYGREHRTPGYRATVDRHVDYLFAHTGFDREPGSRFLLAPPSENGFGGGWRVSCASDCPCGKCWRPIVAVTVEVVERIRPLQDEGAANYYARIVATLRPELAKSSPANASDSTDVAVA